jgi:PAS domain S-box-containing protein
MSVSSVSVKVRLGFTLALIVLGLSGLGSYYSVTAVAEIAGSARHSHRVIAALYGLQDAVKAAEAAQQDFAASRDKRRLDEAAAAHDEALRHLATLNNQPVAKPHLERRVDELDRLVRERLTELKALAAAAAPRPPSPPREDRPLKPLIMSLIADEVHALEDRENEANEIASRLSLIIGAACILTVMIALVSLLLVNKDVAARQEAEMALQEARMNLEVRVNERTLELARANTELRQEIAERQRAQVELQKARAQLEERVRDRTAELGRANTDLRQEIRQRTEAVRALRDTTVLQRAILDSANYVIISTEPDGIIRTFNAAAQRMLGYRESELVGKQSVSLFHDAAELARRQAELSRELGMPIDSPRHPRRARVDLRPQGRLALPRPPLRDGPAR